MSEQKRKITLPSALVTTKVVVVVVFTYYSCDPLTKIQRSNLPNDNIINGLSAMEPLLTKISYTVSKL